MFITIIRGVKRVWGRVALLMVVVLYGVVWVAGADPLAGSMLFVVYAGGVIVLVFYAATRRGR